MGKGLAKRILLLGWDAADWHTAGPLIEAGKMPVLQRLIEQGVSGRISTLRPIISPILWNSIATGKYADKHGILGFMEPSPDGKGIRPVSSTSRRAKALWNILSQHGLRSCVVGWYASHPAEPINGCIFTDRFQHTVGPEAEKHPLDQQAVHPPDLLEVAEALRVHPSSLTAEQLRPFFGDAVVTDQKDVRFHMLAKLLAECASIHNAATYFAEHEEWDLLAVYYDAIDHFSHAFIEFYPPPMEHVTPEDFEIYRYVVEGIYQFHDMMLGRLLQLTGPETTVLILSDHGFYNDHQRPAVAFTKDEQQQRTGPGANPLSWHRPQGIFLAAGPGIKKDELVHGASLIDVAPTVLALLGLPIGDDMDGKPLVQIFTEPVDIAHVPSHETAHPADGVLRDSAVEETDPWAARQALEQLAALGYITLPDPENALQDAASAARERKNNLAQVYFSTHRAEQAVPLLEELLKERDEPQIRCRLALCLIDLGRGAEAEPLLRNVIDNFPKISLGPLLLGQVKLAAGDTKAAEALLAQVQEKEKNSSNFQTVLGQIHLRRKDWPEAEIAFRNALASEEDNPEAHDGLGVALREQGNLEDALNEHMRAASLLHHRPQTHVNLGIALAMTKQIDWAIRAFSIAAELAPEQPFPHRCLAQVYRRAKKDRAKAREHTLQAWELRLKLRGKRPAFIAGA